MRLNLGSGDVPLNGFENLDIKNGQSIYPLVAYADNSVDEIRASHVLEHFGHGEVMSVLANWVLKLKDGGVLKIAVPDFGKIARAYASGEKWNFLGYVCGGQIDANDFHKSIFDEKGLIKAFESLGLTDIKAWQSDVQDCASLPVSLNLQGTKRAANITPAVKNDKNVEQALSEIAEKRKNIYSQFGEDGIIDGIFNRIGILNKWCLEVGAADGILFSNTRRLVEQGWNAILIEKDAEKYASLIENCKKYPNAKIFNSEIDAKTNTLDSILESCGAPNDIDLVCIDIDGQDWHVWNQLVRYQPRVVICEYNPNKDFDNYIPAIGDGGQAGLSAIRSLTQSKGYHASLVTDCNVICVRSDLIPLLCGQKDSTVKSKTKIEAVMSMPRLCFSDNIFSAMGALVPLGINITRGVGVFWGQVLTRLFEERFNSGTEYIIAIDYDTFFTKNQVMRLLQLMVEHPEYDAICPMQIKRENEYPLIGVLSEDGTHATNLEVDMSKEILPITLGHFGLTVFRVSSLKKCKKPWFLPIPDPNGGWGDGRKDEDIYFWENFRSSGLKLGLAHKIGILHLQLMATAPGRIEDGVRPVHLYMNDVLNGGMPEWCEPKVELIR